MKQVIMLVLCLLCCVNVWAGSEWGDNGEYIGDAENADEVVLGRTSNTNWPCQADLVSGKLICKGLPGQVLIEEDEITFMEDE